MNSVLKYHGGKHYIASNIVNCMAPHKHYVEPFFGGGSVLFAKKNFFQSEVVNDINWYLTNFWRTLQCPNDFAVFKRVVDAIPFSQTEFTDAQIAEVSSHTTQLQKAIAFFAINRQSRQGLGKDFATLSRNRTRRNMNEQASSWLSAIDGLEVAYNRLRGVVILNDDAVRVINQQDGPNTLFYCDPPYLHETRSSYGEYEYEYTDEQHEHLLLTLASIQGKFLLSGYHSTMYDRWASTNGFPCYELEVNASSSGKSGDTRTECLWRNY